MAHMRQVLVVRQTSFKRFQVFNFRSEVDLKQYSDLLSTADAGMLLLIDIAVNPHFPGREVFCRPSSLGSGAVSGGAVVTLTLLISNSNPVKVLSVEVRQASNPRPA